MKRSLLFLLLMAMFAPLAMNAQETLTVYDGTNNNSYVPFYGLYADTQGAASEFVIPADDLSEMTGGTITAMTFYLATPADAAWTGTHQVYLGEVSSTTLTGITGPDAFDVVLEGQFDATGTELTLTLSTPYVYNGGNLLIGTYVSVAGNWKSAYFAGVTQTENTAWYRNSASATGNAAKFLPKTTFEYEAASTVTCARPKNVAVEYTGGTTATVTWTGEASSYNIDVNGTVTNNVTSSYTLTGLELATVYEVKVQANCGGGDLSDWTTPKSFTTDLCLSEDMCEITFELTDSYGDSWNGNAIKVVDALTGTVIGQVANQSAASGVAETYTLSVCDGRAINFAWVSGSYASETSYVVYDINGEEIFSGSAGNGLIENYTVSCKASSCRKPTNLAASNIGPRSVELSWTENGEATAWNIDVNGEITRDVTNPYTLTGLTPETTYTVKVTPVCEEEKWSDPITFTTDVACPTPTGLSATTLTPNSATLAWEGFGEGYEMEYAASGEGMVTIDFEDGTLGDWTAIDADGDGYNWNAWTSTEMVVGHNNSTYVVTSASYQGAALTPDNYLVSPQIKLGGSITFWACAQDASWPTEHFGVAVSTTGNTDAADFTTIWEEDMTAKRVGTPQYKTKKAAAGLFKNADRGNREVGNWYEYTIDLSDYSGTGYVAIRHFNCTDMFRLNVDDITIMEPGASAPTWIQVGEVASPYTLNGLEPETLYNVRVRATCGEDGESSWVTTSFTTPGLCDLPNNLVVDDNTTGTSATLNWTGYQESYNVRYRHTTAADPTAPATIILTVGDVWGDGSGYQMLLDADATAYGTIIPTTGGLTTSGDASAETYAEFEYKIPRNADGAMTTENIVINNTITIEIPAGTYDWCITNPTPDDRIWIASENGDVPGRYDDYVFEPGVTYEFTVQLVGTNDGVMLTVNRPMSEWITVEGVTNPYTLTGLQLETYYEWQVQGVNKSCEDGITEWSEINSFTTPLVYIKHIDPYTTDGGYYLIASPIGEVNPVDVTNMLSNSYDLYYFDQSQELEWINYKGTDGGYNLMPGKGYLYANSGANEEGIDLIFTGTAYSGNGEVTLTKTNEAAGLDFPDWNLVGNPFATDNAYITKAYYRMNSDGNDFEAFESSVAIEPMEGIFVVAENNNETLTFSTTAPGKSSNLSLNVTNNGKLVDRAIVSFGQGHQLPKFQLNPNHTKVYIEQDNKDYAIVNAEEIGEMPVNFKAEKNGSYTISFSNENVEFGYLHLIDNMTGADIDLLDTPSYSFDAKVTDYASRFKLVFAAGSNNDDSFAFYNNGNIVINNEGSAILNIVDVLGRTISSQTINGSENVSINAKAGVYTLQLIQGEKVKTQKIVVE